MDATLITLLIVTAATWIGGLPTLIVVRLAATDTLEPAASVPLFRAIGRLYGIVAGVSLIVAAICAALLAGSPSAWQSWQTTCAALTAALVVVTILGVIQARSITRRKQAAIELDQPNPAALQRTIVAATVLRALIAALTLAIIISAAVGLANS